MKQLLRDALGALNGTHTGTFTEQGRKETVARAKLQAALDAPDQNPYGWMIEGVSSVARGDFAEEDAIDEAKRIGGTCYAYPVYLKP